MGIFLRFLKKKSEVRTVDSIADLLNKGDIFIDCGASYGQETPVIAAKGVEVYAFEPNPYPFKVLEEKCKDYPNVHLYNAAVLDRNDKLKLYFHENSDENEVLWSVGSSLKSSKSNVRKDKFFEVDVIDLSEFITDLKKRVRVLKIDVEGAECEIINKLIDTGLHKHIDFILAETHEKQIPEIKNDVEKLKKRIKDLKITNIDLNWI
jgi:FkbM family methyltransferase